MNANPSHLAAAPNASGSDPKSGSLDSRRRFRSPLGPLELRADEHGLRELLTQRQQRLEIRPSTLEGGEAAERILDAVEAQLAEYFSGARVSFELPLAPRGTAFQQGVWAALLRIPCGETRSYGQLAQSLGKPGASRAVGLANSRNPIAIIIPCHRVIGADGSLTGYAGGLPIKRWLLDWEQRQSSGLLFPAPALGISSRRRG